MRDGGLWSAPRYWAVFPHVFFFLVFKMYLFIYPFGLFWADSVSYLKVTRMEPFGQSPIFQLCQGQSVLLYLSIVENTQFKPSLLLFPLFLFLFFLYPLLLLRYSNHIFVFSFFSFSPLWSLYAFFTMLLFPRFDLFYLSGLEASPRGQWDVSGPGDLGRQQIGKNVHL